ncbi:MAG: hypothetical protein ABJF01_22180 [bacterium]
MIASPVHESVEAEQIDMTIEIECLEQTIADELRRAGVQLPDGALDGVAESILADAVRIALVWLGDG